MTLSVQVQSPVDPSGIMGVLAAAMAFSYGGVTVEHFLLGVGSYVIGAVARSVIRIGLAVEAGVSAKIGAQLIVIGGSPFLGAFASLVVYMGASLANYRGDAFIAALLALTALRGPEGIQWLSAIFSRLVNAKLGNVTEPTQSQGKG